MLNAVVRSGRLALSFAAHLMRRAGPRLFFVFGALLLPLWAFSELAEDIHEQDLIPFDEPVLHWARSLAHPAWDRFFLVVSDLGYAHGVVPFDVLLVIALVATLRWREAVFAAVSLGGSGLLNLAAKHAFERERPALWESIAPEATFSFPSGHAMGSATLAWVLLLLSWRTRWRWPVLVSVLPFAVAVGASRVYLGVHYPSDILAGWAAASLWVAAVFLAVYRYRGHPWRRMQATGDPSSRAARPGSPG